MKTEKSLASEDSVVHDIPDMSRLNLLDSSARTLSLKVEDGSVLQSTEPSRSESNASASSSKWRDQLTRVTHMLYFASTGEIDSLSQLLDEGGDVDSADYDGRSSLHLAASEGQLEAVKLLLARGAKPNPKDRWSHTPLTDAKLGVAEGKSGKYEEVVKLLIENGGIDGQQVAPKAPQVSPDDDWELDPTELSLKGAKMIGKGAFGEIWKVTWRGTPVAVKMILRNLSGDSQVVKEFRDEVALLPKLRHPNIVQFLGSVTKSQPLMLVTEFLSGGDLHEAIKENGTLPAHKAVAYALDVARGMNYLHRHKPEAIIHRDLKPRNLLRDEGDHVKVADFGLSKLVKIDSLKEVYIMTGETGSYRYMAPEVFRHEPYDSSVDVFSFGVIFYEMFEGLPPFAKSHTAEQAAWKVSMDNVRPPMKSKHYPPGCKELIQQCWAGVPKERPTFSEVIERLEPMEKALRRGTVDSKKHERGLAFL